MLTAFFHRSKCKTTALFIPGLLVLIAILFSACSLDSGAQGTPTPVAVNGFGSAENHVHSLLAQPNSVLVLATHYGIFRSVDGGANWQKVAAGPNQPMQGLMAYSLVASPLNPQRLYVLTQPATIPHAGVLGLYTSADDGKTWQLAITTASVTSSSIYMVAAGNDTPDEVYIYLPDLGALGLRVSLDDANIFPARVRCPSAISWAWSPFPTSRDTCSSMAVAASPVAATAADTGSSSRVLEAKSMRCTWQGRALPSMLPATPASTSHRIAAKPFNW